MNRDQSDRKAITAYSSYVFDLDGTLFSIPIDWNSVRTDLVHIVGDYDGTKPLFHTVMEILNVSPSLRHDIFSMLASHELKAIDGSMPFDGAIDLVSSLSKQSKLALVTLQGREFTRRILRRSGLVPAFSTILTREDAIDRGEQLLMAARNLGISTDLVLFVGDRDSDVVAARRVGIDVALLRNEGIRVEPPDYFFGNMIALKDTLLEGTKSSV